MGTDITIFYADDDSDDLDFFREVTNDLEGVKLYTHDRGQLLLNALKNPPPSPQIIFLDLNMPGKNGFEVLEELKGSEKLREIPVVIFSTSSDPANIAQSLAMGANFYLPKLADYNSYKKSIEHTLAINWDTFKPTADNFLYIAA